MLKIDVQSAVFLQAPRFEPRNLPDFRRLGHIGSSHFHRPNLQTFRKGKGNAWQNAFLDRIFQDGVKHRGTGSQVPEIQFANLNLSWRTPLASRAPANLDGV